MPTVLLMIGAVLCTALYVSAYFSAEAPKAGSLEWIGMYDKPKMTRQGHTCPMKWLDILWCLLLFVLAGALYLAPLAWTGVDSHTTALPTGWFLFFLAVPVAIPAILAFRLGEAFSGKIWISLITALFLPLHFIANGQGSDTVPLLLCVLLTMAYFSGKGFWSWFSLVLSGLTMALTVWANPVLIGLTLPWLGTILFAEILRMKYEDFGPWHMILALAAAILTAAGGILFLHFPIYTADLSAAIANPNSYTVFWQNLRLSAASQFLNFENIAVAALPAAALLFSGMVMGIGAAVKRHPMGIILLLWSASAAVISILFPAAAPLSLSVMPLAYLMTRLHARECGAAAWIVGLVPLVITLLISILTIWRYIL